MEEIEPSMVVKLHKKDKKCHICNLLIQPEDKVVRDHCHFSGKFRGFAHNDCNFKYSMKNVHVKVVSHNFRGYDKSILLQMKYFSEIKCIPLMENNEKPKCITMSWNSSIDGDRVEFKFTDSFMHLSQPSEVLIQNQANYQPSQKLSCRGESFADFANHLETTNITPKSC